MSGLRIDFSNVEIKSFDLIDPGTYTAKVTNGELTEVKGEQSKNKGAPMIHWEFTIQDAGKFQGWKQWRNTVLSGDDNTLSMLKELLHATGKFDVNGELNFKSIEELINAVVGCDVAIVIGKGKNKLTNEMENKFRAVKPLGEGNGKPNLLPG